MIRFADGSKRILDLADYLFEKRFATKPRPITEPSSETHKAVAAWDPCADDWRARGDDNAAEMTRNRLHALWLVPEPAEIVNRANSAKF